MVKSKVKNIEFGSIIHKTRLSSSMALQQRTRVKIYILRRYVSDSNENVASDSELKVHK